MEPSSAQQSSGTYTLIPASWHTSVREVTMKESREASFALAHAFAADPLSVYLLAPDHESSAVRSPEQTWQLHLRIMKYTFAAYRLRGVATAIGPDYDAIALWTPPGKFMDDWWTTVRSGTWRLAYQLPAESRKRVFGELFPALHGAREEVLGARNDDAYYLGYIGTKPSARGRGCASKLIRAMADKADAENRPMYLESSSGANNPFYSKFGFSIKTRIELKRGPEPVYLYCMVREPQPGKLRNSVTESSSEGVAA
ncbi:hypothetical protein HIM_00557 [Hirsutella minnesotensis 3608]|nr:hypothetical protein HIM_00557 [Hirsutella minnesotensis 3608]